MFMAPHQELMRYAKTYIYIRLGRFVMDLNLKDFFLQSSFHSGTKYYANCQEKEAAMFMNYNND